MLLTVLSRVPYKFCGMVNFLAVNMYKLLYFLFILYEFSSLKTSRTETSVCACWGGCFGGVKFIV